MYKCIQVLYKTSFLAMALGLTVAMAKSPAPVATKAPLAKAIVPLNQKDIHAAYNEGDFDKVVALIDGFNRDNKTYPRADSIIIAKHLAVVYSANPQTREKGRYFMYRLLEMMPSAELVDMFVSDEIDRIFDKVRREFLARQKGFGVDSTQISTPNNAATGANATANTQPAKPASTASTTSATSATNARPFWKRNAFWIASGTGVVIAGAAAIFIYYQDEPVPGKTITISSQTTAKQ
jgi:hypothetical protein